MGAVNSFPPAVTDDEEAGDDLYIAKQKVRRDTRSRLIRSYEKAGGRRGGVIVNACPRAAGFGCKDDELDAEGYCRHLVGTTLTDDPAHYHPLRVRDNDYGNPGFRFTDGTIIEEVLETDRLVRIATCYRVYRADGKQIAYKPPVVTKGKIEDSGIRIGGELADLPEENEPSGRADD